MASSTQRAYIVTDLGFGDFGKGTTVEALVRRHKAHTVVRFSGGAQAGHNIVRPDGTHHTFSQFGAGTFEGARTYLSQHMVVHPTALLVEAAYLERKGIISPFARLTVDRRALMITPFHQAMNRLAELHRGAGAHGSCGIGVGVTVGDSYDHPEDAVRVGDLFDLRALRVKLKRIQDRMVAEATARYPWIPGLPQQFLAEREILHFLDIGAYLDSLKPLLYSLTATDEAHWKWLARESGTMVFENAQGVLLDEWHGFFPHNTYTNTTHDNALAMLAQVGYEGKVKRLGGIRTYQTRHGQGPFPTENPDMRQPELHNNPKCWQGAWRQGVLDMVLTKYAIKACGGIDGLVVTHLDQIPTNWDLCCAYRLGEDGREKDISVLPVNPNRIENGVQTANTDLIRAATPVYLFGDSSPNREDRVSSDAVNIFLKMALSVPVVMGSFGRTVEDKVVYDSDL